MLRDRSSGGMAGLGFFLSAGMVAAAWILAGAARDIKADERYVTVKGLAEKEVKADLAVWQLRYRAVGNDLAAVRADLSSQTEKVKNFLQSGGFGAAEITSVPLRMTDRQTRDYIDSGATQAPRYIIEGAVTLRTAQIEKTITLSDQVGELMKDGVSFSEENICSSGPDFNYTKLNDIKTDMLTDATKNARAAAERFAQDSQSRVGSIRRAYQGVFSVNPRDEVSSAACGESKTPDKKVRVVTTLEYFLKN